MESSFSSRECLALFHALLSFLPHIYVIYIYRCVCVLGARYSTDLFLPDLAGARCNLQVRDTINFMNVCSEEAIFSFFFFSLPIFEGPFHVSTLVLIG